MSKFNNLFANGDSDAASEKRNHILYLHITTKPAANQLRFAQHCSKQSIFPPLCRLILYPFLSAVYIMMMDYSMISSRDVKIVPLTTVAILSVHTRHGSHVTAILSSHTARRH